MNLTVVENPKLNKVYSGRRTIYTDYEEVTFDNVLEIIEDTLSQHYANFVEIAQLRAFEKNNQPILRRKKDVRPEINYKICENHAHEIKEFKKGYVFGQPITYVQRAGNDSTKSDEKKDDKGIDTLNQFMFEQSKSVKDLRLAEDFTICGIANRIVLPNKNPDEESPFKIVNLDPCFSYVVRARNIERTKILGVSFNIDKKGYMTIGAYSDKLYFEIGRDKDNNLECLSISPNGIGAIPIVEYENDINRMGSFEVVIPLLNAINLATSDRINGLAQFIQSFIWFNNIQLNDGDLGKLKDNGAIVTKDLNEQSKASIQYLVSQLNQTEVQTLVNDLYDQVLKIAGVPKSEKSSGGNTGQAIIFSDGWQIAETQAQCSEIIFNEGEKEMLAVCKKIIDKTNKKVPEELKNLKVSDIEIKFNRDRTDSMLVKTQGLTNMLNAGIHPRIAIKTCGLFCDPQQVWADSAEYLEKWVYEHSSNEDSLEEEEKTDNFEKEETENENITNGENNLPKDIKDE